MSKTFPHLSIVLLIAGCAGQIPADPSKMTAEQLKALAADRSAIAACTLINGPWGVGRTILVQLDRAAIVGGGISVGADCTVQLQAEQRVQPPAPAASR